MAPIICSGQEHQAAFESELLECLGLFHLFKPAYMLLDGACIFRMNHKLKHVYIYIYIDSDTDIMVDVHT